MNYNNAMKKFYDIFIALYIKEETCRGENWLHILKCI